MRNIVSLSNRRKKILSIFLIDCTSTLGVRIRAAQRFFLDGGRRQSSSLPLANLFVIFIPVILLANYCAVGSVPTTPVNGLFFAIVALE